MKPGGIPTRGFLSLRYYSGADLGCAPLWPVRKELMKHVLSDTPSDFEAFTDTYMKQMAPMNKSIREELDSQESQASNF